MAGLHPHFLTEWIREGGRGAMFLTRSHVMWTPLVWEPPFKGRSKESGF